MRYKSFGKTNLQVSHIGFGSMHLPKLTQSECDKILNYALDLGINYIDTAQNYSDSEEKIGRAIHHRRNQYVIGTKTNKRTYKQAKFEIQDSLKKLRTEFIDILHIHYVNSDKEFEQVMGMDGAMKAVEEAKEAGYIRNVAISSHRPDKLAEWVKEYPFDSVLFHLNICQSFAVKDLLPHAKKLGIGTIGMKVLAGGFLNPLHSRYLLTQDVDIILPGFMSITELDENVQYLEQLPDKVEQKQLEQLADIASSHNCRRCNQCECPQGIKITDALIPSTYLTEIDNSTKRTKMWKEKRGPVELCRVCTICIETPECEKMCPYHVSIRERILNLS
ncbi:aldo/keto reductase [Desulfuribacillus alkaliarsenatis]|uniref:NADP-dependent oxidoreductase domain-containing protein n=1 Tax=Desulfuribacillus alkaliarsenatis TaxID=766136 RepID=A0A1E5G1U8_9FIRM|nr:aldo/keto reductase [Desulfuribacillus alkaliarsenatis]OEF96499.1 hypothetical protein BHF68_07535 [Desulfuribacillus alkaliarsenatis]